MNKFVTIIVLAVVSALSSQAACCGKKCGVQRTIKVGGCCQQHWNPIQSTENAPWKVVPYDIQMLSDDSLVKKRYRRKGFAKECPSEVREFEDFERLAKALNPVEWGEFRTKLGEMNAVYRRNQVATANRVCKQ